MYAQIYAGITVDCRPKHHCPCETFVPKQQREKERGSETVGGMARYEPVTSSPVTVHDLHQRSYLRIPGWTETGKIGFAYRRGELIAQRDHQRNHHYDQQCFFPIFPESIATNTNIIGIHVNLSLIIHIARFQYSLCKWFRNSNSC